MRTLRLYCLFAGACLLRELMFRANFLVRLATHVIWLSLMLAFFQVIFRHTRRIGDWDEHHLLAFVGTYLALNAAVNCLFMSGCIRFSELVRSGNLDFELVKPVDEQFLLTCNRVDWALFPQVILGLAIAGYAGQLSETPSLPSMAVYFLLLTAGVAILYSLLVILTAFSVWTVRYTELYELWFYLLQFGNYPDDIYRGHFAGASLRFVLTYVLPILLAVNVPARYAATLLDDWRPAASLMAAAIISLAVSRAFFRFALRCYQGASS